MAALLHQILDYYPTRLIIEMIIVLSIMRLIYRKIDRDSSNKKEKGILKGSIANLIIAVIIFAPASMMVYYALYSGVTPISHSSVIITLILMVLAKLYALTFALNYFFVRGSFDEEKISYYSIWRGKREEKWDDLIELYIDKDETYFDLTFESGTKIRISILIKGYMDVLKTIDDKGEEFWYR